jgi:glutathione S-transferase
MQASPVVLSTALVTILAIVVYFYMGIRVGQLRVKHGVKAPATSGHPEFDRAFRVQMNTLEHLPVIIPLLWLTTFYFAPFPMAAPALGLVWVLGRVLYMDGYMRDPEKRGPGFGLCAVAEILLLILALIGITLAWISVA